MALEFDSVFQVVALTKAWHNIALWCCMVIMQAPSRYLPWNQSRSC